MKRLTRVSGNPARLSDGAAVDARDHAVVEKYTPERQAL
jgi:hypothetical protein